MIRVTSYGSVFLLGLLALLVTQPLAPAEDDEFTETRWVSILSAYPTFADAEADAKNISRESGLPFSMEGRIYETKRGLIYPDHFDDDVFAGNYVARRYNDTTIGDQETSYLSIERSDGYDGFRPGYYIVVAGIYESADAANTQSDKFRKWAPTAYSKKTKIFMGCLH